MVLADMKVFLDGITRYYCSFMGTTSRRDFWLYMLVMVIINAIYMSLLDNLYDNSANSTESFGSLLYTGKVIYDIDWVFNTKDSLIVKFLLFIFWYVYLLVPTAMVIVSTICMNLLLIFHTNFTNGTESFNFLLYHGEKIYDTSWIFNADGTFAKVFLLFVFWYAYLLIPTLSITVRRLHDTNKSIWWVFAYVLCVVLSMHGFFPLIFSTLSIFFLAIIFIFCLLKGQTHLDNDEIIDDEFANDELTDDKVV